MNITAPTRFVGLHSHTTHGSVFDAIGTAADHINFAMSNGADALALTDHGNMCGYSHQMAHLAKLKKKDIQFKGLFGMEAYYIPSLKDWALLKEQSKTPVIIAEPGDELASAKHELQEMSDTKSDESEEEDGGTIVENEEESKSGAKGKNPLKQRNHLVLLAKNSEGLQALFNIASDAAADGSYMGYPRVDMDILRKHAKGNIVAMSACICADAKLLTNYGEKTIKEVTELVTSGHEIFVLGWDDNTNKPKFAKVTWAAKTRTNTNTVTIKLKNGKTIRCTEDHKFLTQNGWKTVAQLKTEGGAILNLK